MLRWWLVVTAAVTNSHICEKSALRPSALDCVSFSSWRSVIGTALSGSPHSVGPTECGEHLFALRVRRSCQEEKRTQSNAERGFPRGVSGDQGLATVAGQTRSFDGIGRVHHAWARLPLASTATARRNHTAHRLGQVVVKVLRRINMMLTNGRFLANRALRNVICVYDDACAKQQPPTQAVGHRVHRVPVHAARGGHKEPL